MIGSFKDGQDGELARFYLNGKRSTGIPSMIEKPFRRKLSLIEAASSQKTLCAPPSNNYERLPGKLEGWSSIRVSLQWSLIFRWRDGHAYEIYLDPHTYR